jgi:hypothetical protein
MNRATDVIYDLCHFEQLLIPRNVGNNIRCPNLPSRVLISAVAGEGRIYDLESVRCAGCRLDVSLDR